MKHTIQRILALCLCMILCLSVTAPGSVDAATKKDYETFAKSGNQANDLVKYALSRVGKKDERSKMCAGFVVTCAKAAGMTSNQINMSASIASPWTATNQFNYLTNAGNTKLNCKAYTWKDFLDGTYKPQKGDLVFYGYIKGSSAGSAKLTIKQLSKKNYYHVHVGIIRDNSSTLTKLYTVDGGQTGSDGKSTWVAKKTRTMTKSSGAVSGWKSSSKQVYALEFIRPNYSKPATPADPSSEYLAKCTKTASTYVSIKVSGSSSDYIKTLPCAASTCEYSKSVRKLVEGETLTATAIYRNTGGNYWYKVKADSDGKEGYVYGAITTLNGNVAPKAACTGAPSISTTTPKYGNPYTISGTIKSTNLTIIAISASLRNSTYDKNLQYKLVQNLNTKSYKLASSPIDMNLKFGKLPKGKGCIAMNVALTGKYIDGNTVKDVELHYYPARFYYTVK